MPGETLDFTNQDARSNWIKLQTLVIVRWFAIIGQLIAILVARYFYNLDLPFGYCLAAIAISASGNIFAAVFYPDNKRLTETETVWMLLFDLVQLGVLLALTGGLNNPFALLVLAPVTIAASALPTRLTIIIAAAAIGVIIAAGFWFLPLVTMDGVILQMPDVFVFGLGAAIVTGVIFISVYTRRVTTELTSMTKALQATQMALAREQKLTDLGGVIAATAHELGTPLATIKLVSSELIDELSDLSELQEDAKLIGEQADRCRDILRDMGRAGKDDLHLKFAPLEAVVEEAAEPHIHRGKTVTYKIEVGSDKLNHPEIARQPEIIHGLRNLIQNAVDFARDTVSVTLFWTADEIGVSIQDDGPGFSHQLLGRIGDPFLRQNTLEKISGNRQQYEGMGLGLFIAKTLLERSGAHLEFRNSVDSKTGRALGALVFVTWDLKTVAAPANRIGDNIRFD